MISQHREYDSERQRYELAAIELELMKHVSKSPILRDRLNDVAAQVTAWPPGCYLIAT